MRADHGARAARLRRVHPTAAGTVFGCASRAMAGRRISLPVIPAGWCSTTARSVELARDGTERTMAAGEVLYRPGDAAYDFIVILEGEVEVVREDHDGDHLIVAHGAGRFLGELNLLTGQRAWLTAPRQPPGPASSRSAPRVPAAS